MNPEGRIRPKTALLPGGWWSPPTYPCALK